MKEYRVVERRSSATPVAVIVVVTAGFIMTGVWWIEDRFSSTAAIMVIGGLFGVICLIIGYFLSMANTRYALNTAGEFNRDLAQVEKYRQSSFREIVKADGAERAARARIEVIDAKRVDEIAQKRAGLLVDLELQRLQEQTLKPAGWALVDDDNDDAPRFLE